MPLQDPYSEALLTQAKLKRKVLRRWWNCNGTFGRCLRSVRSPFHIAGPTTDNEWVCVTAERANVITKLPWTEDTVYDGLHKKREGGRACADRRAPSQTSTTTPGTRSCKRCVVGMEVSAIHPANIGICGQTS